MNGRPSDNRIIVRGAAQAAFFSVLALPLLLGPRYLTPAVAQGPAPGKGDKHDRKFLRMPWNQKEIKERLERLPEKERLGVELVQRMVTAQISQPFIAREISLHANGKETEQWVRWDPMRGMRRESIRPAGEIFMDDLKNSYIYVPREKQWMKGDTILPRPQGRISDVLRRLYSSELKATLDGQDTIGGRIADIVRVEPKKGDRWQIRRFWVDRPTGIRLKMEEINKDGRLVSSSYYVSLDLNPRFRDDDFTAPANAVPMTKFRKSRNYQSVDEARKAGFVFRQPTYIPAGFELQVVDVFGDEKDVKFITLRYRNGISVLSFTQSRLDKTPPKMLEGYQGMDNNPWHGRFLPGPRGDGERVYIWRDGDTAYALFGNLSDTETRRIAASLR